MRPYTHPVRGPHGSNLTMVLALMWPCFPLLGMAEPCTHQPLAEMTRALLPVFSESVVLSSLTCKQSAASCLWGRLGSIWEETVPCQHEQYTHVSGSPPVSPARFLWEETSCHPSIELYNWVGMYSVLRGRLFPIGLSTACTQHPHLQ